MSDSIIERLRHHAQDELNTSCARSTMREAEGEIRRLQSELARIRSREENRMDNYELKKLRQAIANDSYAMTFQSMAQYRSALLKLITLKE